MEIWIEFGLNLDSFGLNLDEKVERIPSIA